MFKQKTLHYHTVSFCKLSNLKGNQIVKFNMHSCSFMFFCYTRWMKIVFLKYIGRALCVQSNRVGPDDDSITAVSIEIHSTYFSHTHTSSQYKQCPRTIYCNARHNCIWPLFVLKVSVIYTPHVNILQMLLLYTLGLIGIIF